MAARTFAFKALSLLVIFVFLFSNTAVARAQQPDPGTVTPPAPSATPATPAVPAEATPTAAPTQAPTVFTISGKVTGKDGLPLAGVSISDDHGNSTATAADGSYALPGLKPGTYMVTPKLEGQALIPYYRVVKLVDKDVSGVDFYPPKSNIDIGKSHANPPAGSPAEESHSPVGQPAQAPNPPESDLSSQAVYTVGAPGLSYRYASQIGISEQPYLVDPLNSITHLNGPSGIALDQSGNLLEVEEKGSRLVRFNASGVSNLSIGKPGVESTDNYSFYTPNDAAEKPDDHSIWVGDLSRIVKYDASGNFVLQFPASDPWDSGSDNGHFHDVRSLAFNPPGSTIPEVYVADRYNNRVQVFTFDTSGNPVYARTIGETGVWGSDDSHFSEPWHITYYAGYLYVADMDNQRIMKCDPESATTSCSVFFGVTGEEGHDSTHLSYPSSIAFGAIGGTEYAFIADAGNLRVLKCAADGSSCAHFAGTAGEDGTDNEHFAWPADIAVGATDDKVYVADRDNARIQVFNGTNPDPKTNWVETFGTTDVPYTTDKNHLYGPDGIVMAPDGSLYVMEVLGYTLVKYNSSGVFQWRKGQPGVPGWDIDHFGDFGGNQLTLGVDSAGRIYVPDSNNDRIIIYLPDGTAFNTFGSYGTGNDQFACPTGVAIRPGNGDIYIEDHCNMRVQVYDSQWHYKGTIGETNVSGSDSDHFTYPNGLAVDANGNVYVADHNNDRVQKCKLTDTGYTCVPFAGVTGMGGRDFRFNEGANDVTIGPDGLIYVVEVAGNDRVQVYDPSGAYRTSMGGNWGSGTGTMRNPDSAIVDGNNNVYVTDQWNGRVVIYARGMPGWSQLNVNGWDEYFNSVNSLAEFNNKLYAGIYNNTGSGSPARIYRYNDDGTWTGVVMDGFGDSANIGIDALIASGIYLYAGVWHNGGSAQIWRSSDGVTWTQVSLPDGITSNYSQAYLFEVFNTALYLAPYGGSQPAEIWRCPQASDCGSADNWEKVVDNGFWIGMANASVSSFANAGPWLVAGTYNNDSSAPGGEVWVSPSGDVGTGNWTNIEPNGFGDSYNSMVSSLEIWDGYLYAGTTNLNTGAQVWRCQVSTHCTSWTEVVSNGFGSANNTSIPVLKLFNNKLYAFTDNENQGVQVFSTDDGTSWSPVINGTLSGFGNNLRDTIYSPAAAVVHQLRLMVGVNNHYNPYGGQVWASDAPETYAIHGTITPTSGPLPDSITLTLQPGGTTTSPDGSGAFPFSALPQGSYSITPFRAGCTFTPTFWQNSITDNVTIPDFNVTCATPKLLSPADGTQLNSLLPLTLSWSAVTNATKYNFQVSTTSATFASTFKSVTQAGTSYVLSGMAAGATYYWRVKESAPVAGAWSVIWKFYAPTPPAAPAQLLPTNNAVLAAGNFRPVFTWKPAAIPSGGKPVEHYHLQVSQKSTFAGLDLDEYTLNASTSYTTPFDLTPNRVFYWRIRAFNTSGGYSASSSVRSFKTLPGPVGLDGIQDQDTLRPTFHWHDDWNTGKYTIQICKRSGSTCSSFKSATLTGLSYSLTSSLAINTVYQWRVQAVGTAGAGAWTDYASWTSPAPPAVPALATPLANETIPDTANPNYQMSFTWKSVKTATSGAIKYQLQVSWQTDFEPDYTWAQDYADPTLGGGAIVSYPSTSDQAIWSNSTNYWRVRACGSDGCSLWTSARKLLGMPATPAYVGEGPLDNTAVYAFHWTDDNSNPADKYNIQICNNATCSSKFKSATVSNGLEYDLLLPSNKAMWWRVQGVGVTTGGWMLIQAFHTVTTPGVPSLVSPASNAVVPAPTGIGFSWNLATGADGYEIQISTSSAFDNMNTDPSSIDQTSSDASSTADWPYGTGYWRVRAQTGGYYGQWSSGRKFTTKPYMYGFVYDLDGNPLVGAAVSLAGGYSTTTIAGGEYWLLANLPTGTKILTVTDSPGYLPMTRSLSLSNGGNYYSTNVWLPPVDTTSTDYRFVLSWADPTYRDLDLHAWLPAATPEHIFWQNPGTLASFPFAQLSVNDITPDVEVLDVGQFQTGKTVLAVNQYYPTSGSWSATNVKVEVYQGTTPVISCPSPSGSGH